MIRRSAALVAMAATLLASCSMVPHYDRPKVAVPPEFKEAPGWRVASSKASSDTPARVSVGISSALRPSDSMICNTP